MIKKVIVSFGLLFSLASVAQEGTASPYSYYGIGDVKFKGTAEARAMGGINIPDSIHINLGNPAGYSGIKLTTFSAGGSYNVTNFKTKTEKDQGQRTTIDYLAFAFPAGKLGFGAGLMPYSSVGYKVRSTGAGDVRRSYSGEGGVNKVYFAAAYQVTPKLSVGADFNYNFGDVETKNIWSQDIQYSSRELNASDLTGFNFNLGAIYASKIKKKYDFFASAAYTPESTLKSENKRTIATVIDFGGVENVVEERNIDVDNVDLKLPSKLTLGTGFGVKRNWFVAAEVALQQSSSFGSRYNDITNVAYENSEKFSIGGYFIPNFASYTSYFKKMTYRAGLKYEKTGLVIANVPIKDYGFSLGVGLPVSGSTLNIGFEYGKRGTTEANLVKENYANIFIGLSLNDKWFVKRKYD